MCTVLGPDMVTVKKDPVFIVPATHNSIGTQFEGHAFFEAPSIRKKDGLYYFIYSSQVCRELCYATSKRPDGDFTYRGVLVDNGDISDNIRTPLAIFERSIVKISHICSPFRLLPKLYPILADKSIV